MVRLLGAVAALSLLTVLAGCDTAADAGGSFGNGELVNDVATRLAAADAIAYTAEFSLEDNASVSIAHTSQPDQTAYRYPGGMVLLTPTTSTVCATGKASSHCTTGGPATPRIKLAPALDTAIEKGGLIRPETVISMLTQTSLNADALVSEQDRTIAGTNATCVTISGVAAPDRFTACVTTDGLLGSFTGMVGDDNLNVSLDHYTLGVDSSAFALPADLKTAG